MRHQLRANCRCIISAPAGADHQELELIHKKTWFRFIALERVERPDKSTQESNFSYSLQCGTPRNPSLHGNQIARLPPATDKFVFPCTWASAPRNKKQGILEYLQWYSQTQVSAHRVKRKPSRLRSVFTIFLQTSYNTHVTSALRDINFLFVETNIFFSPRVLVHFDRHPRVASAQFLVVFQEF